VYLSGATLRFYFVFFLLLSGLPVAQAQDSLAVQRMRRLLAVLPPDTNRVRLLDSLSIEFHDNIPERGIVYGQQGLTLARRLHDQRGRLHCLLSLGSCYVNLSDSQYALQLYQQAISLARRMGSYDGIVSSYDHMASVHYARGDTATMWRLYRPALKLAYHAGVQRQTQITLFGNVGVLLLDMNRTDEALSYLHRALQMARRIGDRQGQAIYMANLGSYYQSIGRYDTAESLLRTSIALARQLHNSRVEAGGHLQLSEVLLAEHHLEEAENNARSALQLARMHHHFSRVLDSYSALAEIAAARGTYSQAYAWQQRYLDFNDTLNNHDRLVALAALQSRYETQDKEQQIQQLTTHEQLQTLRNQQLNVAIIVLVLGLTGFTFLYVQLRRSRTALAANHIALQETSAELQRIAASKDRLYSIIAHDLRGPITSFAGVTELIEFYLKRNDDDGLRRLPALIRQSTAGINHLLDNLLNWAVSQTGELAFLPQKLPVQELLSENLNLYQTTAQAKQVQLTALCSDDLHTWADRNMTRTILRNILGNALKFVPNGGHVQMTAEANPTHNTVLITCTDSGPGMSAAQVEALVNTDSLPRTSTSLLTPRDGTGLGLVLCRAFVARQGGSLRIRSTQGVGTTVEVELPVAQ